MTDLSATVIHLWQHCSLALEPIGDAASPHAVGAPAEGRHFAYQALPEAGSFKWGLDFWWRANIIYMKEQMNDHVR
ncbi:MAG TPA: hypothetical protein VF221_12850, partial [Chloroflexota bacterium]